MRKSRPNIITLYGDLCILGAIVLILTLIPNFLSRFGITLISPPYLKHSALFTELLRITKIIALLITAYGYLKLKKWGYWLMVGTNLIPIINWIISLQYKEQQLYNPFPMTSIICLIFVIPTVVYFYKKPDSQSPLDINEGDTK